MKHTIDRYPASFVVAALAMLTPSGAAAQYDGNSGAVDQVVQGMYGASTRDQHALERRQAAEQRQADNKEFYDKWDRINQQAMQRAIIRAGQKKAALAACRKTAAGCTGRFTPGAGHPGVAYIARELGKTPQEQLTIRELSTNYLATYNKVGSYLRLPANDLAGPMAYAFLTAMRVYKGESPAVSPALTQIVVGQAREMIANNGGIALMNSAQRHEHAEALAINGAYLASEFEEARRLNDAPRLTRAKRLAGQVVEQIVGARPEALAITNKGVVATGVNAPATGERVGVTLNAATTTAFVWNNADIVDQNNMASVNQFNQLLRQRGGVPNDLAWGMAGSIAILLGLGEGVQFSNRQLAGTAETARRLMLEAGISGANRDRQQAYEKLVAIAMRHLSEEQRFGPGTSSTSARYALGDILKPFYRQDFSMTPDGLVKR